MSKEKRTILIGTLSIITIAAVGTGLHVWITKSIPYSYRQNPLDIVDYVTGKNVFNRANSLQ